MFEQLFKFPSTVAKHESAPYAEERARYLIHCAQQGYSHATIMLYARELLWVAQKLSVYPSLQVTRSQIEAVSEDWTERERCWGQSINPFWARRRFMDVAKAWLRFLGYLQEPIEPTPFGNYLDEFVAWMKHERGLADTTIEHNTGGVRQFLRWYTGKDKPFKSIQLSDIDVFLAEGRNNGWRRVSVKNMANILRAFFRYAAMRGWCSPQLADSIRGPRIFALEALPRGPDWSDVQRLLAYMDTDQPRDIRDRAILLLLAIYGLRASEVTQLRLDDIDWEQDLLHVSRVKRQSAQTYPLLPVLGNAIIRYLEQIRPASDHRQLFLTLLPPFRPLSPGAVYGLTQRGFKALSIKATHRGPHALRHACAAHLVAEGLSLKTIGDHLGHRSASATRIYAKVDLTALREVAVFDLGELL
jgi:site-specific recombinase XerD